MDQGREDFARREGNAGAGKRDSADSAAEMAGQSLPLRWPKCEGHAAGSLKLKVVLRVRIIREQENGWIGTEGHLFVIPWRTHKL
jgi:hypothetical protein